LVCSKILNESHLVQERYGYLMLGLFYGLVYVYSYSF